MARTKSATAGEPTEASVDAGRREALRKFGRYAAAGPAAVLLLGGRTGRAGTPPNGDTGYDGGVVRSLGGETINEMENPLMQHHLAQQIPTQQIKLLIFRNFTPNPSDLAGQQRFHEERRRLLNGLIDSLDLQVIGGIYDVDPGGSPREVAEVIIAIGIAIGYSGVLPAMVEAFKVWVEKNKVERVRFEGQCGIFEVSKATPVDMGQIVRAVCG